MAYAREWTAPARRWSGTSACRRRTAGARRRRCAQIRLDRAVRIPIDGLFLDFVALAVALGNRTQAAIETGRLIRVSTRRRSRCSREATGALPPDLDTTSARAAWIRRNRLAEWIEFKCKVVSDFVGEARSALKEAKADAELGIYVVPDVNGLTEPLTGQRIKDLAPLVDWIAPMLYHNILLQPPAWVASTLAPVVEDRRGRRCRSCKPIRTATRRSSPTGDLRCRTSTGAKRFRRSPDGLISAD